MVRKYSNSKIAIEENLIYPSIAPFNPSKSYPEYRMKVGEEQNTVYEGVRNLFHKLNLDKDNYGTVNWNPLGTIIKKGQTVLLKPNFVQHMNLGGGNIWSIITHPSVIRAVVDYVYLALGGEGRIIIADAPSESADFKEILSITELNKIREYYKSELNFDIEIYDFRENILPLTKDNHMQSKMNIDGDPNGYTLFDLGDKSNLCGFSDERKYYGSNANRDETIKHHASGKNEYLISNTVLTADVVISLSKMKTHGQVGATLNVKNFIGSVVNKNCLPHYRLGDCHSSGDEFHPLKVKERVSLSGKRGLRKLSRIIHSKALKKIYKIALSMYKKLFSKNKGPNNATNSQEPGYWFGNDTLWRTVLDVFNIVECGKTDGTLSDKPCRKVYGIVDGVISGEHNGPNANEERNCGVLIFGDNLVATDLAAIRLMGFDYKKIPLYKNLIDTISGYDSWIKNTIVLSESYSDVFSNENNVYFDFIEPDGWKDKLKI